MLFISATLAACTEAPTSSGLTPPATASGDRVNEVIVSSASPFAGCEAGALPRPSSRAYTNAEVEPGLAVNPTDPANMIGVYQQDRWSDGAARGIVVASTVNGGAAWKPQPLPFSSCAGGSSDEPRAGDPWVVFGPTGIAWVIATATDGVRVATSSDKGSHWRASTVYRNAPGRTADKPWIASDPGSPATAYATWYTIERSESTTTSWFSKTTDGGLTWSTAARMASVEPVAAAGATRPMGPVSPQLIVTAKALYVFSLYEPFSITPNPPFALGFQRSLDRGRSWSRPRIIQDVLTVGQSIDPNNGRAIRSGAEVVNAASDPATGTLYVVWQDSRFEHGLRDQVALSRSADGGEHWSIPTRVNAAQNSPGMLPAIAVRPGGEIAVSFMDWRALNAGERATLPASYWLAISTDGGVHFAETPLSARFDLLLAPDSGGLFLGDYTGLAVGPHGYSALFATTNEDEPGNPTDIRFVEASDSR